MISARTLLFLGIIGAAILIVLVNETYFLNLCGEKYSVPFACHATSGTHLKCDDFEINWFYPEPKQLDFIKNQCIRQFKKTKPVLT